MNEAELGEALAKVNSRRALLADERAQLDAVEMKLRGPSWQVRYQSVLARAKDANAERKRLGQALFEASAERRRKAAEAMCGTRIEDADPEDLLRAAMRVLFSVPRESVSPELAEEKDIVGQAIKTFLASIEAEGA